MVGRSDGQVNADAQMLSFEISPHFRTARSPLPGLALRRLSFIDLRVAQVPTASKVLSASDIGSFMRRFLLHRQADKLDGRTHMQFLPRLIPLPRMIGCSTFDLPERRNCMECVRMSSLWAS